MPPTGRDRDDPARPNRKLVTFHDAFPYFAAHYGFELVGVILPNVGQEPSAAELAALVDKVKAANVKAVFSEAQFSPELAHTLAQEAGITTVVTTLYNDTVGPPPNDTYLKMMAWNIDQIVQVAVDDVGHGAGRPPPPRDGGYGDRVALTDVDLEIATGSLLAVIGPNGSGKSTLLKTIAGLLTPFEGTVEVFGGPARLSAKRIAYVPQAELVDLGVPGDGRRRGDDGPGPAHRHGPLAGPRRTARPSRRHSRPSGWPTTGTARSARCRAASAAGSSSPRRSRHGPTCTCSTSRSPGSTSRPRRT